MELLVSTSYHKIKIENQVLCRNKTEENSHEMDRYAL